MHPIMLTIKAIQRGSGNNMTIDVSLGNANIQEMGHRNRTHEGNSAGWAKQIERKPGDNDDLSKSSFI